MGLVKEGSEAAQPIENQLAVCRAALKEGVHVSVEKCEDVLNTILRVTRDEYHSPFFILIVDMTPKIAASTCTTSDCAIPTRLAECHGLQI